MKSAMVVLGGQGYEVKALPMKQSRDWRKRLEVPFGTLAGALEGAGSIELTNGLDIGRLVRTLSGTLIGSIDLLMELLFAYSPELAADRERIEEEAYDEEALIALTEVLKLAYPFGVVLGMVNGRMVSKT